MSIIWGTTPERAYAGKWSQEDSDEAQRMHDAGKTDEEIGARFSRTANGVRTHLQLRRLGPEKRKQYLRTRNAKRPKTLPTERPLDLEAAVIFRPTAEMLADRDRRAVMPCRDLTSILMGDPPIGLSALDQRA